MDKTHTIHALRIATGITMLALLLAGGAGAATITVNASGGADYTKIQDAINAASNGDTISVGAGIYNENVDVNKTVNLVGSGSGVTIVRASNPNDHVFDVTVNSVNISGFRVTGVTGGYPYYSAGISLTRTNYSNISNNNASYNNIGIKVQYSSNNNLTGNNVSNNSYGIYLDSSGNNNLTINNALNNNLGIVLYSSSNNNNLTGNNASNNNFGIWLYSSSNNNNLTGNNASNNNLGIRLDSSSNNNLMNNIIQKPFSQLGLLVTGTILQNFRNKITTSNTVNGMPIMYIDGVYTPCSNDSVFSLGGSYSQITFVGCDNVTLQDSSVIDTITLAFTTNSTVKNSNSTSVTSLM